jgi:hypothetical protein
LVPWSQHLRHGQLSFSGRADCATLVPWS